MPIEIDTKFLRSVSSMKEDKAGQIIDQTRKVVIGREKPIDVEPVDKRITVEVPPNLGVGSWVIVLINKEGKTLAVLPYDQEAKKILKQEDEDKEDDE